MENLGGISVDKAGLANAANKFSELQASILTEIKNIEDNIAIIEENWSGPQHDLASSDKSMAEGNIADAKSTLGSMNNALGTLSSNASKITYM